MRKFLLTAAALGFSAAALASVSPTPAHAGSVCLTDPTNGGSYQNCEFYSFRECRASSIGVGGSCVRNPTPDEDSYSEGPFVGPSIQYGSSYNRYDGPVYGGRGYVRSYGGY